MDIIGISYMLVTSGILRVKVDKQWSNSQYTELWVQRSRFKTLLGQCVGVTVQKAR